MKVSRFLFLLFLVAVASCSEPEPKKEFNSYPSPGGAYTVVVRYGEAGLAYGPQAIEVAVRKGSEETILQEVYLNNDGANIGEENIQVEWVSDDQIFSVTLKGKQQSDSNYVFIRSEGTWIKN